MQVLFPCPEDPRAHLSAQLPSPFFCTPFAFSFGGGASSSRGRLRGFPFRSGAYFHNPFYTF